MTPLILKQLLIDAIQENFYLGKALIIDNISTDTLIIKLKDHEITLKYSIESKKA